MDEKLNYVLKLIEDDKKICYENENNSDLTNFEIDFPIKSIDELDAIEIKISNNTYRSHLVGIRTLQNYVKLIYFYKIVIFLDTIYFFCWWTNH